MHTLILSISCSVAVSVLLKLVKRYKIDVAQAIAMNYVIALLLCVLLLKPQASSLIQPSTAWWVLIMLGILLPTIFIAMAKAVEHAGIVLSDAAQRLSLIIPLLAAFFVFNENMSTTKIAGVTVAILALALLLVRKENSYQVTSKSHYSGAIINKLKPPFFLLCVWLGYGTIDILFKQMARSGTGFASSLAGSFILAGIIIWSWLLIKKTKWSITSLKFGTFLGLLNFGNIFFYIKAHQAFPDNPTLVFSAMNTGVITIGVLVGAGFFKERLNAYNIGGISCAILAIILLVPR